MSKTRSEVLDLATREVLTAFNDVAELDAEAKEEVERLVHATVGRGLDRESNAWERPAFHNLMIGQAYRIADRARMMTLDADPKAGCTGRVKVGKQAVVNAGVEVMTRTHDLLQRRGGCVASVDNKLVGLPRDGTEQGGLCEAYVLAAVVIALI